MIFVIAELHVKPGTADDVVAAARPCIKATREEDGCIAYELHRSVSDENTLVFVERWKDRASIDAHFRTPHMKVYREAITPHLTGRSIELIQDGTVETL